MKKNVRVCGALARGRLALGPCQLAPDHPELLPHRDVRGFTFLIAAQGTACGALPGSKRAAP